MDYRPTDFELGQQPAEHGMRNMLLIAGIINSALYLLGVFIAGLVTGNPWAWKLALLTLAVCYLCALVQVSSQSSFWQGVAFMLVALSITLGGLAGAVLL